MRKKLDLGQGRELGSFDIDMKRRAVENIKADFGGKGKEREDRGVTSVQESDDEYRPIEPDKLVCGLNSAWEDLDSGKLDLEPSVIGYQIGSTYPIYDRGRLFRTLMRMGYHQQVAEAWLIQFTEILDGEGGVGGIMAMQKDDLHIEAMCPSSRKRRRGKSKNR